jgi:hypothetical protein
MSLYDSSALIPVKSFSRTDDFRWTDSPLRKPVYLIEGDMFIIIMQQVQISRDYIYGNFRDWSPIRSRHLRFYRNMPRIFPQHTVVSVQHRHNKIRSSHEPLKGIQNQNYITKSRSENLTKGQKRVFWRYRGTCYNIKIDIKEKVYMQ